MRGKRQRGNGKPVLRSVGVGVLSIFKCSLCQQLAVAEADVVRFRHGLGMDDPSVGVTIHKTVPACEEHRAEVAYRTAWNIFHKHVAPMLEQAKRAYPTHWETGFTDGRILRGQFSKQAEGVG